MDTSLGLCGMLLSLQLLMKKAGAFAILFFVGVAKFLEGEANPKIAHNKREPPPHMHAKKRHY